MSKFIDMTGQQYGSWKVIERDYSTKDKNVHWWCECECGQVKSVAGIKLRQGKSKSCGCKKYIDITGQRFGKLIALEPINERLHQEVDWKCKCDCGNICIIRGSNLRSGYTSSCGCIKSKGEQKIIMLLNENNIYFEKEKSFPTCKFIDTNKNAYFDFYLPNYNCLIEYDGQQHFSSKNHGWNNQEAVLKIQQHDEFKNQWCKENNISLIRIPYTRYNNLCIEDLLLETSQFII